MEGQFYLMGVAGLGISLAGFSSLLTVFRASGAWDEVSLSIISNARLVGMKFAQMGVENTQVGSDGGYTHP